MKTIERTPLNDRPSTTDSRSNSSLNQTRKRWGNRTVSSTTYKRKVRKLFESSPKKSLNVAPASGQLLSSLDKSLSNFEENIANDFHSFQGVVSSEKDIQAEEVVELADNNSFAGSDVELSDHNSFSEEDVEFSDNNNDAHEVFNLDENELEDMPTFNRHTQRSDTPNTVKEDLFLIMMYCLEIQATRSVANKLLALFRKLNPANLQKYPKDYRTILPDIPKFDIKYFKEEEDDENEPTRDPQRHAYIHFGIQWNLETNQKFFDPNLECVTVLSSIDGVGPYKTSRYDLWPITGRVKNHPVFLIGLYCGPGKPSIDHVDWLMDDFVNEINDLQANGMQIKNKNYSFKLTNIVPDAQARCMILKIQGSGAFAGCPRCHTKGKKVKNVTVFLDFNSKKRTQEEYVTGIGAHHKGISPLTRIRGFICPRQVTLDIMHLIYLGIVPRWFTFVMESPETNNSLTACKQQKVSLRLTEAREYWPAEFQRASITLEELKNWKATQYRSFILYLAPWVLRDIFKEDPRHYENILYLCTSLRILCSEKNVQDKTIRDFVLFLFKKFISLSRTLYGDHFVCYNVHLLIHLIDDVEEFGVLEDNLSAWEFESWYRKLLSFVHSGNKPLQQIASMYYLWAKYSDNKDTNQVQTDDFCVSHPVNRRSDCIDFKHMFNKNYKFRIDRSADSFGFTRDGGIVKIINIKGRNGGQIDTWCQVFRKKIPAFHILQRHASPGLYEVSDLSEELTRIKCTDIVGKCLILPMDAGRFYAAKFLH